MVSQLVSFHSTLRLRRLAISLKASYSQPMPCPVFGSAKLSGVYAFSVTATTLRPAEIGQAGGVGGAGERGECDGESGNALHGISLEPCLIGEL